MNIQSVRVRECAKRLGRSSETPRATPRVSCSSGTHVYTLVSLLRVYRQDMHHALERIIIRKPIWLNGNKKSKNSSSKHFLNKHQIPHLLFPQKTVFFFVSRSKFIEMKKIRIDTKKSMQISIFSTSSLDRKIFVLLMIY